MAPAISLMAGNLPMPAWVEQGPGPISNGQITAPPNNAVAGAVQALAIRPGTNTVFAGTVAGGVWRTTDITGGGNPANVTWEPLTDQLESLYVGALAFDPSDSNTLFVGTGSYSNTFRNQLPQSAIGLYRTTNANDPVGSIHWQNIGRTVFQNLAIRQIEVSPIDPSVVFVAAADEAGNGGLFRSVAGTNFQSWTTLSNGAILPYSGGTTDVLRDPNHAGRYYAAAPGQGVFRTDNGGTTWVRIDNRNTAITGIDVSTNIRMALTSNAGKTVLYVGVVDDFEMLSGVFRYAEDGVDNNHNGLIDEAAETTWKVIGTAPVIHNGGQGFNNFSITADPTNIHLVYVGGDEPPSIFRGNDTTGTWTQLSDNPSVSNTGPHADSRELVFLNNTTLLETDDGGIFRLTHAQNPAGGIDSWTSLAGNLRDTELHGIAYDTAANLIFGGAQDNGSNVQSATGSQVWNHFQDGDGSTQAYSIPGNIRYTLGNNFGNFNHNGTQVELRALAGSTILFDGLENSSGPGNDQDFANSGNFESRLPVEANRFNANSVLLGRRALYESTDQGDHVRIIPLPGKADTERLSALVYGGRRGGTNFANVFYVGTEGGRIYVRDETGKLVDRTTQLNGTIAGGDPLQGIALDPDDYRRAYVLKGNRIAVTTDMGLTWQDITDNLGDLTSAVRSIALVDGTPGTPGDGTLMVGGLGGVFHRLAPLPGACPTQFWTKFGNGLPETLVQTLQFVPVDPDGNPNNGIGILLAGTFGRGAWTISNVSATAGLNSELRVTGDSNANPMLLRADPNNPQQCIQVSDGAGNTQSFDKALFSQVSFQGMGGGDTIIVSSDGTSGAGATGDVKFVTFLLNVAGGGQASDVLVLGDSDDRAAATVTVTASTIGTSTNDTFFGDCGRVSYAGLGNLTINLSNVTTAGDVANVQGTAAGTTTRINGNGGNDTFNVSSTAPASTGNLNGILGTLSVDAGAGGANRLIISNFAGAARTKAVLNATSLSGFAPAPIFFTATGGAFTDGTNGDGILIRGSSAGGDRFTITGQLAGSTTTVQGNGPGDLFTVLTDRNHAYAHLVLNGGLNKNGTPGGTLKVIDVSGGAVLTDHRFGPGRGSVEAVYLSGSHGFIDYTQMASVSINLASFRALRAALVQGWYQKYLHRNATPAELQKWVSALQAGQTAENVQASILGSQEYFALAGFDNTQFLRNLIRDVLGRPATPSELSNGLLLLRGPVGRGGVAWFVLSAATG